MVPSRQPTDNLAPDDCQVVTAPRSGDTFGTGDSMSHRDRVCDLGVELGRVVLFGTLTSTCETIVELDGAGDGKTNQASLVIQIDHSYGIIPAASPAPLSRPCPTQQP
jgi:hypothetical protein